MYAYCLYCETQRCKVIAQMLEQRGIHRAFSPQIVQRHRKQGVNIERSFDLLPGYIFAYTEEAWTDFSMLRGIAGIHRKLGDVEDVFALKGLDHEFAMNLYEKDGIIGVMKAFKEGDRVILADPLFSDVEGQITQVDYRKGRVRIDYRFNGVSYFVWAACDVVNAVKQPPEKKNGN